MLKDLCPGCPHHCYLDEPHCERGAVFAATGTLPPRKPRPDGGQGHKPPNERKVQYRALDQQGKLIWSIRELNDMLKDEEDGLFSCLREDDRAALLMLLEKVRLSHRHI